MNRFAVVLAFIFACHTMHIHAEGCPGGVCPLQTPANFETTEDSIPEAPTEEPCKAYIESSKSTNYAPAIGIVGIAIIAVTAIVIQDAGLHHNHGHY